VTDISRRAILAGLSACCATPVFGKGAWPERPITLIHGFPPGGPVDVLSRILAEPLGRRLGQPVIVEAKPGATGTTAAGLVSRAAPDGYTLMAVPATFTGTAAMFRTLPYNPTEDFTFISSTAEYPLVLITHADSEFRTLADVVRVARSRETPLQFGTAGIGSIMHLTRSCSRRRPISGCNTFPIKAACRRSPICSASDSILSWIRRPRSFSS